MEAFTLLFNKNGRLISRTMSKPVLSLTPQTKSKTKIKLQIVNFFLKYMQRQRKREMNMQMKKQTEPTPIQRQVCKNTASVI